MDMFSTDIENECLLVGPGPGMRHLVSVAGLRVGLNVFSDGLWLRTNPEPIWERALAAGFALTWMDRLLWGPWGYGGKNFTFLSDGSTAGAIKCILSRGQPPFVDFGVFGPHAHRIMRKVKLSGFTIGRDGQLQTLELLGPANISMWEACYNVLMNALVMVDAVDLGALMSYKQHIIKLHDRYSAKIWPVIYQADNRCRLEHMERTRRVLQSVHDEAVSRGSSTDYDDARPWNLVFRRVVTDETFWRDQVVEPALLVLTKVAGIGEMVQGDAGIGPGAHATGPRETEPRPARMAQP